MRRPAAAATSLAWFVLIGGTFGCLLPYLLNYWHFRQPLPYWGIARAVGVLLICAGLVPIVDSFIEFVRAAGTPVPVASPPRLVVQGFYRYVRNPIYVGFLLTLLGQTLLFGSRGLLVYTAAAWCVGAAGVRFYEEPVLARKFGAEYEAYRHAVPAWLPVGIPGYPGNRAAPRTHRRRPPAPARPAGPGSTIAARERPGQLRPAQRRQPGQLRQQPGPGGVAHRAQRYAAPSTPSVIPRPARAPDATWAASAARHANARPAPARRTMV